MKDKEIEKRVDNQIQLSHQILELMEQDGHTNNMSVVDLLDELACLGIELVENKDINVASIAYFGLIQKKWSINKIVKEYRVEYEKANANS